MPVSSEMPKPTVENEGNNRSVKCLESTRDNNQVPLVIKLGIFSGKHRAVKYNIVPKTCQECKLGGEKTGPQVITYDNKGNVATCSNIGILSEEVVPLIMDAIK